MYLVDRFVHVELQVEEWINIRQHLARQIGAEVHHYLARNDYTDYRDHLLHAIDVFLLGYLLLNTELYWIEGSIEPLVKHLEKLAMRSTPGDGSAIAQREWMKNWAVASLLHDIGYQIGHGRSVSVDPEVWDGYFSLPNATGSSWLGPETEVKQNERLEGADSILPRAEKRAKKFCEEQALGGCMPTIDGNTIRDHGVLSALRIAQVVWHAGGKASSGKTSHPDRMISLYREAIHAVAYHNLAHETVSFESKPLACLLRLCDELQEWDRRRVNIGKVVKQLYLDIQEGRSAEFTSYEIFDSLRTNIQIKPAREVGGIEISLSKKDGPQFQFDLLYRDPISACFEPTMTLLCKAHNLQHLDLNVSNEKRTALRFCITLRIPLPTEYGNLAEYDIYSLFTENQRSLPLLRQFESIEKAEAGLIRLPPEKSSSGARDCFAIILTGTAGPDSHHGWLPLDPSYFFDEFIKFKESVLISRRGGQG